MKEDNNYDEEYSNVAQQWRLNIPRYRRLLDRVEDIAGEFDTFLDFGCGTGIPTKLAVNERRKDAHGVDINERDIKKNNQVLPGRYHLIQNGKIPFGDGSFDVVYSSEVLEHIPEDDIPGVIAELVRVSNKDIFLTICTDWEMEFHPTIKPRDWWGERFLEHDLELNFIEAKFITTKPDGMDYFFFRKSDSEKADDVDHMVDQAKLAIHQGYVTASHKFSDKAISLDPNDRRAYTTKAKAYNLKGWFNEALDIAGQALTRDDTDLEARVEHFKASAAMSHWNQDQDYMLSLKNLERETRARVRGEDMLTSLAVADSIALFAEQLDREKRMIEPALYLLDFALGISNHKLDKAKLAKGRILGKRNPEAGIAYFEKISATNHLEGKFDFVTKLSFELGKLYLQVNDQDKALRSFKDCAVLNPSFEWANYNLANAWWAIGNLDRATQHLHEEEQLQPGNPTVFTQIGHLYIAKGERDIGIQYFEKAMLSYPHHEEVLRLVNEDPFIEESANILGFMRHQSSGQRISGKDIEQIVSQAKVEDVADYLGSAPTGEKGRVFWLMGKKKAEKLQFTEAVSFYEAAYAQKQDPWMLVDMGTALSYQGKHVQGLEKLQQAQDQGLKSTWLHSTRALMLINLENFEQARQEYGDALKLDSSNIHAVEGLSYLAAKRIH